MIADVDDKTSTIPFTDDDMESANTIRVFLGLVTVNLPSTLLGENSYKIFAAVPFLRKYQCDQPRRVLKVMITQKPTDTDKPNITPWCAFGIAVSIDDFSLATDLIEEHTLQDVIPEQLYTSGQSNTFINIRVKREASMIGTIPWEYQYALMSTFAHRSGGAIEEEGDAEIFTKCFNTVKVGVAPMPF